MKKTILIMISILLVMCSCTSPIDSNEVVYQEYALVNSEYCNSEDKLEVNNELLEADEVLKDTEVKSSTTELQEQNIMYEDQVLPTLNTLIVNESVSEVKKIDDSTKDIQQIKVENEKEVPETYNLVTISIVAVNETILETTLIELQEEQTVFDVLSQVTRENKIHMDYSGRGGTVYIKGINNIYEYDMGAESGWMYRVNGEFPNTSSGNYVLESGDVIEWIYTLNLGRDLEKFLD